MLRGLGAEVREVRVPRDLEGIDALVIPGGESTTMTLGIAREGLAEPIRALAAPAADGRSDEPGGGDGDRGEVDEHRGEVDGHRGGVDGHRGEVDGHRGEVDGHRGEVDGHRGEVDGHRGGGIPVLGSCAGLIMLDREHLGLMDMRAQRNAFGRQIHSFEADVELRGIGGPPLRGVFIRAPWIAEHGPRVEILAELEGHPIAAREGDLIVVAFHAELTDDVRVHRLLLDAVARRRAGVRARDRAAVCGEPHGS
jgi:glutamine amidotransferase PdxT